MYLVLSTVISQTTMYVSTFVSQHILCSQLHLVTIKSNLQGVLQEIVISITFLILITPHISHHLEGMVYSLCNVNIFIIDCVFSSYTTLRGPQPMKSAMSTRINSSDRRLVCFSLRLCTHVMRNFCDGRIGPTTLAEFTEEIRSLMQCDNVQKVS